LEADGGADAIHATRSSRTLTESPALRAQAHFDEHDVVAKTSRYRGRKLSLYFPPDVLDEIRREARRLRRSTSWVVQRAWKLARAGEPGR
jgi:uncharacterized small protein (TIGR04563 family)